MRRKKWVRPAKPLTTSELASLYIPPEAARRKEFANLYREKTGYAIDATVPLEHALMLITGSHKPKEATEFAVRYLMFGIPAFAHRDRDVLCGELVARQFALEEAIQYLARYEPGLSAWQFIQLANSLAAAKAAIRRQASTTNLEHTEGEKEKSA